MRHELHKQFNNKSITLASHESATRKDILEAVASGVWINLKNSHIFCMHTDFHTQITSTIGKWSKSFFTNGDVIDLLNAMAISQNISDPRDHLYTIIKSRFPDCTMQNYKIYKKALTVKMKVEPRKSRRNISSSCIKLPGNKCALLMYK